MFWGRPGVTDVVSLAYLDPPSIEIIINVEQARRQTPWGVRQEIVFLYIHGILHILGHRDNNAKNRARMLGLGLKILRQIFILD